MIRRVNLIFHFEGGRVLIINGIDRVYRKMASCRLVEIIKKTLGIRIYIQEYIFNRSNLFHDFFAKEASLLNLNGLDKSFFEAINFN